MMTTFDLVVSGFVALVVLPLAISSLIAGSPPPPLNMFVTKYYVAEPRLMLVSNLFLLAVCATAVHRLATHFGFLSESTSNSLELWIGVPFLILLLAFLGLFIKAILKVRRADTTA
jgi:protein-S-isoprenylcysteine O-methyltransferase Ste14